MATVNETTDYNKFKLLVDNRQTARNHINRLKDAILRNPEILKVQPILVNHEHEIIDGQHRFVAASELGLSISYTVVHGLDISTARDMNVLQRRWTIDDFAYSYAKAGNVHYKAFNQYRREYPGITSSVLMMVMGRQDGGKENLSFREGKFIMGRDKDDIDWILDKLVEIREVTGGEIPLSRGFVSALLQCLDKEDFKMEEFMEKLKQKPDLLHRTSTVRDALRMIEDIYNFRKQTNLIRLY